MSTSNRFGVVASYVHADARMGALVELRCDSRVASLSPEVRELAQDLAMQVAATGPRVMRREDLTPQMLAAETQRLVEEEIRAGRSSEFAQRVAVARVERFHEWACLLEQKFVKNEALTVSDLLGAVGEALKEQISVVRFVRFATGASGLAAGEPS
jgi:elongation factor Ts